MATGDIKFARYSAPILNIADIQDNVFIGDTCR